MAQTEVECYTLDRATFNSLLGPVEDLWRFEALRKVCACRPGQQIEAVGPCMGKEQTELLLESRRLGMRWRGPH